jgi:EAL domain-containing protein (putative c-di-GMP-specific phosphodiesterase class I)
MPIIAMYVAKRNDASFTVYQPDIELGKTSQLSLLGELRSAVEEDQLTLYYQPKVDLRSGASDSVEALVPLGASEAGLRCLPSISFRFAEQTGYIKAVTTLGARARAEAMRRVAPARRGCQDFDQHVGAGPVESGTGAHGFRADSAVQDSRASVCLEITESAVMEDPAARA